jgi:hypothetical protein
MTVAVFRIEIYVHYSYPHDYSRLTRSRNLS